MSCNRFVVVEYCLLTRSLQPLAISFSLAFALAVTQGLGQMALPLILPAMTADLGWTYTQAGMIAAASPAGLLLGLCLSMAARTAVSPVRLFQLSLVVVAAALIATGATRAPLQLWALRFATGFATAPILACGASLASSIYVYEPDGGRRVLAIFCYGVGAGIVAGGALLPPMLDGAGTRSWPEAWLTLGLIALVSIPFALWASQRIIVLPPRPMPAQRAWPRYAASLAASFLFTAGLTAILTFLPSHAHQQGANAYAIVSLWITLGLAGILARAFWEPLLARLSTGQACAAPMAMAALGALFILLEGYPSALIVSGALIGFGAFMVPATLVQVLQDTLPRECWPRAKSVFFVSFALSQTIGALAAGFLADRTGNLQMPLVVAGGCLVAASLLALLQTRPAGKTGDVSGNEPQRISQLEEPPVRT